MGGLSIYDLQGRSRDTCVGAYVHRSKALSSLCPGVSSNMPDLDLPFVPHVTEVEYKRRISKMLGTDISSESNVVDLSCCWLPRTFSSFYLMREVDTWGRDLELKVLQRSRGLLVGWHNIELIVVPSSRR